MPELRIAQSTGSGENIDGFPGYSGSDPGGYSLAQLNTTIQAYLDSNGYTTGGGGGSGGFVTSIGNLSILAPTTENMGDIASSGSSQNVSREDHVHGLPGFGSVYPQLLPGASPTDGYALTVSRSDHAHGTPQPYQFGTVVAEQTFGGSSSSGVLTTGSRSDHTHGNPSDAPLVHLANAEIITGAKTFNAAVQVNSTLGVTNLSTLSTVTASGSITTTAGVAQQLTLDADASNNSRIQSYNNKPLSINPLGNTLNLSAGGFNTNVLGALIISQALTASGTLTVAGATQINNTLGATGTVTAGAGQGFRNATYQLGVANPIWSFANASTFGMAYYQENGGVNGITGSPYQLDAIGFHFNTIAAPPFAFYQNGSAVFAGNLTAPNVVYSVTASGNMASSGGQNPAITITATPTFTQVTVPTITTAAGGLSLSPFNGQVTLTQLNSTSIINSGTATIGSTLGVTGATTLSGAATLQSTLSVTGNTTLSGSNTINNTNYNGTAYTFTSATDGLVHFTSTASDGTTFLYADTNGTQKIRLNRNGNISAASGIYIYDGNDVINGAISSLMSPSGISTTGTLSITGTTTLKSTLAVSGTGTFSSQITVQADLVQGENGNGPEIRFFQSTNTWAMRNRVGSFQLGVSTSAALGAAYSGTGVPLFQLDPGALTLTGTLNAQGTTVTTLHATSTSGLDGAVSMGATLTVTGATSLNNTLTVAQLSTLAGVNAQATTVTTLASSSTATFAGNTNVTGVSTFTVGTGATSLGGALTVTGLTTLNNNTSITGASTFSVGTGASTLGGTLAVTAATNLNSTLIVAGAATHNSTTTLNGNTSVTGGSTFTVASGQTTLSGGLIVAASTPTSLTGTLTVTGATNLNNTLHAVGAVNFDSTLYVTGDSTLTGNVTATSTGTLVTVGDISVLRTFTGNVIKSNNIIDGQVQANDQITYQGFVEDPSFEDRTPGFTTWILSNSNQIGTGGWAIQNDVAGPNNAFNGTYYATHTGSSGTSGVYSDQLLNNALFPVIPGQVIFGQAQVKGLTGVNGTVTLNIVYYDSAGNMVSPSLVGATGVAAVGTNAYLPIYSTSTAPSGAVRGRIGATVTGKTIGQWYIDGFSAGLGFNIPNLSIDAASKLIDNSISASKLESGIISYRNFAFGAISGGIEAQNVFVPGTLSCMTMLTNNYVNMIEDGGFEDNPSSATTTWDIFFTDASEMMLDPNTFQVLPDAPRAHNGQAYLLRNPSSSTSIGGNATIAHCHSNMKVDCKYGDAFYAQVFIQSQTAAPPGALGVNPSALATNGTVGFGYNFHDSFGQPSFVQVNCLSTPTDNVYQFFSAVATAPLSAASVHLDMSISGHTQGFWLWDDVFMTQQLPATVALLPGSIDGTLFSSTVPLSLPNAVTVSGGKSTLSQTTSQSFGSIDISGSRNSWAGISFSAIGNVAYMLNVNTAGVYDAQGGGWRWYFSGPATGTLGEWTLNAGNVPASRVNGGNFGGAYSFSGGVTVNNNLTVNGQIFGNVASGLILNLNRGAGGYMANITNNVDQDIQFYVTPSAAADKYSLISPSTANRLSLGTNNLERASVKADGTFIVYNQNGLAAAGSDYNNYFFSVQPLYSGTSMIMSSQGGEFLSTGNNGVLYLGRNKGGGIQMLQPTSVTGTLSASGTVNVGVTSGTSAAGTLQIGDTTITKAYGGPTTINGGLSVPSAAVFAGNISVNSGLDWNTPAGTLRFVSNAASSGTGGYLEYSPGADATNRLSITGANGNNLTTLQLTANYTYMAGTLNVSGATTFNSPITIGGINRGSTGTNNNADIPADGWLGNSNLTADGAAFGNDLNLLQNRSSGFYNASSPLNAPRGIAQWFNIIQARHTNKANNYGFQLASEMTGATGLYYRQFQGGSGTDATVPGYAWYRVYTEENPPPAMTILAAVASITVINTSGAVVLTFVAPSSGRVRVHASLLNGYSNTFWYFSVNNTTYYTTWTGSYGDHAEMYFGGLSAGATYSLYAYESSGSGLTATIGVEG